MDFWIQAVLICLVTLSGAFVQRVSGFGFGILVMMFLPHIMGASFAQATALSSLISFFSTLYVALSVVKKCDWKTLVFPLIGCFALTFPCLYFLKSSVNQKPLFIGLGVLLVVLSIYFLLFSSKIRFKPHWYSGLLFGAGSGTMNGLFSMGGPPAVIYFLQTSADKDVYLATIQMYFLMTNIYSNVCRIAMGGFYTKAVFILAPFGIIGMIAGNIIGKKVFGLLDTKKLRYCVYGFMAVSGVINVISAVMK
ncbi:MAG: sulfite exporter TauE/SafE family protein [Clostridia bacterium]|nr:sulfite exporter TauE/SafE family protein [Clostridia bacterium]